MKSENDLSHMQLHLHFDRRKEHKNKVQIQFILASMLSLTLSLYVISFFGLENISFLTLLFSLAIVFILFVPMKRKTQLIYIVSFLSLFFIILVTQYNLIFNGFFLTFNQVSELIGSQTGILLNQYVVSIEETSYKLAINLFFFIILLFIMFFNFFIVFERKLSILYIVITFFILFHIFTSISGDVYYQIILLLTFLLVVIYSFVFEDKKQNNLKISSRHVYFSVVFTVTIFTLLFFIVFTNVEPIATYNKSNLATSIENKTIDLVHQVRFEKEVTNSFTHGDLSTLGELQLLDVPALEVIMDKPTTMYLKGFIGAEYNDNRWLELTPNVRFNSRDLFYWLNEADFTPYNQLHQLFTLTNGNEALKNEVNVTIHNINENSKYVYYPYELRTNPSDIGNVEMFADTNLFGEGFFGERSYRFAMTPNLVTRYPEMATKLYEVENDENTEQYLLNESHYNEFVYEHYTMLPEYVRLLMENHLRVTLTDEMDHVSYEQAIYTVKKYLYDKIKYNPEAEPVPQNNDFLIYFLEEYREGYAAHYATAATVMFRYLGIPSRYVEGFLITPEHVSNLEPYEKLIITGENAHAWTEIYIDKIGWIPIEVTPPYYEKMDQVDLSHYPESNEGNWENSSPEQIAEGSEGRQEVFDEEQPNRNDIKPEKESLHFITILIIILLFLVVVSAIVYIMYVYKKRMELKRLFKSFSNKTKREVIPQMFSYAMKLLHFDGIPKQNGSITAYRPLLSEQYSRDYGEYFIDALKINQKALYSNKQIDEGEYEKVKKFMTETIAHVTKSKNIWQKLKMKYIDFVV